MSRKKYGIMPPAPAVTASVKGDAGEYKVWGIDWLNHKVLLDRAGFEWYPIDKVALPAAGADQALALAAKNVLRAALDNVELHPCDRGNDDIAAQQLSPELQELYEALKDED